MIIAGQPFPYAGNFHNDQGTLEDPTGENAQLRDTTGTWSALATPTKQNAKTGHYGGSVDTTGFTPGVYLVRMEGVVTTAKTTAKEFEFTVQDPASFKSDVSGLSTFDPSADILENSETYDETWRIMRASAAGLLTRTGDVLVFKGANGTTTRITATVDSNNNRTLVITNGA